MSTAYRPRFHITPPQGRLNDPNGMFLDGDTLHVFYQHDPAFPEWAKRTGWGHASAQLDELVWMHHPDALYPDAPYDLHGCYSGGAARGDDGQVYLFYTGNLKVDGDRIPSQNAVTAEGFSGPMGGVYRRVKQNPLINGPEDGFTGDYRDPMVTKDPTGESVWRMVIGAQREDKTPAVALYRGDNLLEWQFAGALEFDTTNAALGGSPDIVPGGFMWECPNLITLRDQETGEDLDVLIICPQGLEARTDGHGTTHYASSDQCGYIVGKLRGTTFEVLRGFTEIDYGHQFYAPQVIAHGEGALMVGWMGLPAQDETPTVHAEGWVHCLTTPRQLTLVGHELRQELLTPAAANVLRVAAAKGVEVVLVDATGHQGFSVSVSEQESGQLVLRIDLNGDVRQVPVSPGELVVYVDGCAVEITAGDGQVAAALVAFSSDGSEWEIRKV